MKTLARGFSKFYDTLASGWEKQATERFIGLLLLWVYLLALASVELNRWGLYPGWLPPPPPSHYYSVQLAFTLILGLELIELIFAIPASLARSIGKQMEILTLILLRNAFKELSILPEPVNVSLTNIDPVFNIAVSASGALFVFACRGYYRKLQNRQSFPDAAAQNGQFIFRKKILSLCLMLIFIGIGFYDLWLHFQNVPSEFFETIYTTLIFADIAMVLMAQRFMPSYFAVFRNSGFVMGTLLMRLSLSAPPLLSALLAVFSGIYIICLTWLTNYFSDIAPNQGKRPHGEQPKG